MNYLFIVIILALLAAAAFGKISLILGLPAILIARRFGWFPYIINSSSSKTESKKHGPTLKCR